MKIPLAGQDFTSRSVAVSAQTCINLFAQILGDPNERAKGSAAATAAGAATLGPVAVLYGCPGKHLGVTLATDVRALWSGAGRLFVISGTNEIELNQAFGIVSSHAYAGLDDGLPAQIFSNGNQLLVIAGGLAFCDNGAGPVAIDTDNFAGTVTTVGPNVYWQTGDKFLTNGSWTGRAIVINGVTYTIFTVLADDQLLLTVTPPGGTFAYSALGEPLTAVTGGVMNGTFFVQRPPTVGHPEFGAQVNFSAVLDGTSWHGLDFFRKEGAPDNIVGILTDNNQLYTFGAETFEVFQADPNAGVDGAPFVSIPGAMAHYGAVSPWGMFAVDGRVFLMGSDDKGGPIAYVLNGFTPVRISTHAEEFAWRSAGLGRNVVGYTENIEGHTFCCWNFGAQTWCYDPESGAWHRRAKWNGSAYVPYLTNLHTFIPEWGTDGKHITACTTGPPKVYEESIDFYDDEGTDIRWERALPHIYNDGKWQFFGRCELEMETGTELSGAPVVTMDYSDDRGETFTNPRTAATGVPGATKQRVFWLRGGKSRGRVPRLSGIGQNKVALINLEWDITLGTV